MLTPPAPEDGPETSSLTLAFRADPVSIRSSLEGLLSTPPLIHLRSERRAVAELVLAEVLNNVAEHAYDGNGGRVEVALCQGERGVRCLIVDEGRPMPGGILPEGRPPDGADVLLDDLPEGGFGWHLIRSLCTDLTYVRVDEQNRLSFVLPLDS